MPSGGVAPGYLIAPLQGSRCSADLSFRSAARLLWARKTRGPTEQVCATVPLLSPSFCRSWAAERPSMPRMTRPANFSATCSPPPSRSLGKEPGGGRPGNGWGREVEPLLLFSFRQTKCVLESPTQFGNTAVSLSSHPGKTGSAFAAHGIRRGSTYGLSLLHRLLYPERVLSVRNGYMFRIRRGQ